MKNTKLNTGLIALLFIFFQLQTGLTQIAITELNYHSDSLNSSGDWIEIHNYSSNPVDITGWTLRDGSLFNAPYAFPTNSIIPPNGYLVLGENAAKFQNIYGMTLDGILPFQFSNKSEQITLRDAANVIKIQFTYGDSVPWSKCADGLGRTLEIINEQGDPNDPKNWSCGCIGGSPKAAKTPCINEKVIVSEINYNSLITQDPGDWVELRNTTGSSINISGWRITDKNNYNSFTFPTGTILNPFARLVVYADNAKFTAIHPTVMNKVGPITFGFSADGDGVRLYEANNKVHFVTYYNDNIEWPQGADGHGFTLELDTNYTNDTDVCSPKAWFDGCFLGSPGKAFLRCPDFSVDENGLLNFRIYPNPTQDYIITNGAERVKILDLNGKLISEFETISSQENQLNISHLKPGIYMIQGQLGEYNLVQKLVKH